MLLGLTSLILNQGYDEVPHKCLKIKYDHVLYARHVACMGFMGCLALVRVKVLKTEAAV